MLPPIAKKYEHKFQCHSSEIVDEYDWLRDRKWPNITELNPNIMEYLVQENQYFHHISERWSDVKEAIVQEIKAWFPEEERSVPTKDGDYYYYSKITSREDYHAHLRIKEKYCDEYGNIAEEADHELILDENVLSEGREYFRLGCFEISDCGDFIAYSCDFTGNERYDIFVRRVDGIHPAKPVITDAMPSLLWRGDGKGLFYFPAGKEWRSNELKFHDLDCADTEGERDITIYKETDNQFSLGISRSTSNEYVFLHSSSANCDEILFFRIDEMHPRIAISRECGWVYDMTHHADRFYFIINDRGANNRLIAANINDVLRDVFCTDYDRMSEEIFPHDASVFLAGVIPFERYFVIASRIKGLDIIRITDALFKNDIYIDFPDQSYSAYPIFTHYHAVDIRYGYSSLSRPNTVFSVNIPSGDTMILKNSFAPDSFDSENYIVERRYARYDDEEMGEVEIPLSIVRRKDMQMPGPTLLYGYGSYEISIDPSFRKSLIPLLDRGFCFAIGHIRGGGDMGRYWYEQAKIMHKKRTFHDFQACGEYLINNGYARKLAIQGGSAGGMLVGACLNMKPEMYHAAIADVPFVDVLNTMLDESLPLTPGEYGEWGNPEKSEEHFNYIKSYSPYDNVKTEAYPHIFVTGGLNDPRVAYWEPAKWVARLREKTRDYPDAGYILLKTNLEAGHGGKSGRMGAVEEIAEEYGFLLHFCN